MKTSNRHKDPFLTKIQKEELGFVVPKNYFEEFSVKINEKAINNQPKSAFGLWVGSAVTACSLLLLLLFLDGFNRTEMNYQGLVKVEWNDYSEEMLLELVDEEDVIDYLVYEELEY